MTSKIVSSRPTITRKEMEGVLDCLINEELATGSTVKNLEKNLADLTELKYMLTVSSLTAAYHLVFAALELGPENEVIMPSFFHEPPLNGALIQGCKPVLVDSEDGGGIHPSIQDIKELVTEKTAAIVVGDLFGFHVDLEPFQELNIPVIHDISWSLGTVPSYELKPAFTVASFASDMMLTTGNGAMIGTGNSRYFSTCRELRSSSEKPHFDYLLSDLQGAMGISQLMKLKDFIKRRRAIAKKYSESLVSSPHQPALIYNEDFSYQAFPVYFDAPKDRVERFWKKSGVETGPVLPTPLHALLELRGLDFPNSDRLSRKLYKVPLYPNLTKKEIETISRLLASFI